jgi:hypothetical protein
MTRGSPQLPPRSLRHHRKEQERGENRQVDDSLQHRRAAGAERDHADYDGQRQQHLLCGGYWPAGRRRRLVRNCSVSPPN